MAYRSNAEKTAQYLRNNPFLTRKHASFADLAAEVGKQIAYVAAGTVTAAGVTKGIQALGARIDQNKKSANIAKMYAVTPQMRTLDPKMVSLVYDSLFNTAPKIVNDPLLASQYIMQYAQRNQHDLMALGTMGRTYSGMEAPNPMALDMGRAIANAPAMERQLRMDAERADDRAYAIKHRKP